MSLTQAIDKAVNYVLAHSDRMSRDEVTEFRLLAETVFELSLLAGLVDALPKVPQIQPQLESDPMGLPPVQFESKLNLPGDWDIAPSLDNDCLPPAQPLIGEPSAEPAVPAFLVCATPRWFDDMQTLRKLSKGGGTSATTASAISTPRDSLTDNEYTILRALADARPRTVFMAALEANTAISRKDCGKICKNLSKRGLVDYDARKRRGASITTQGEQLLSEETTRP